MIQMNEVEKIYQTDMIETVALSRISLRVDDGEFVAITGPSGSGKTTFLNVLGLLDDFQSGRYLIDDIDVRGMSDRQLSKLRNEKIGFIFQGFNLIPDLDVFDNIDVPLRYRGIKRADRKQCIEDALKAVGLMGRRHHYPSQLSGGQQQRVAIARVLASETRLILADEPTGNLDTSMAREVMDLLQEANERGTTIIMVTHSPECADRARRRIHLLDGALVDVAPVTTPALARA